MGKFKDAKMTTPDKFQPHSLRSWTQFNRDLQNYLASIRGISGVPLCYVIRKQEFLEVAPPGKDAVEEMIRLAPYMVLPTWKIKRGCTKSLEMLFLGQTVGHGYNMFVMRMAIRR